MSRTRSFLIHNSKFIIFLFIALLLRLILIPNPGFEADMAFWKSWSLGVWDKGLVEGIRVTNNNYPIPFGYILYLMGFLYSRFANPHNFTQFWTNTNVLFLAVAKLFPILADFGIAGIILYIGKHAKRLGFPNISFSFLGLPFYALCSILYLLSPIGLLDGALWGQVDSLGVFVFLCSLLFALKRKPFLAGFLYMAAVMTKLQNMIYGPLFFLLIWQTGGFQMLVRSVAGATVAFLGLNIEFFLARDMGRVITSLVENYDYFPYMSLNAFNLWWIVAGGHGMQMSDKMLAFGIANAKTVGLILFSSFYLFAALRQFLVWLWVTSAEDFHKTAFMVSPRSARGGVRLREPPRKGTCLLVDIRTFCKNCIGNILGSDDAWRRRSNTYADLSAETIVHGLDQSIIQTFLSNLIIVNAAFFLFMTQSHDRYLFPLSVFLLLWIPFCILSKHQALSTTRLIRFSMFYLIFTTLYSYNLHTALVLNYPDNGIPILSSLTQPALTVPTAFALLALFFLFIGYLVFQLRSTLKAISYFYRHSTLFSLLLALLFCIGSLLATNQSLLTKQPISLTKFTPYITRQDWGFLRRNMPTAASTASGSWDRLSVQYAFYEKGLGTHTNSSHTYHINGLFKRFTTDYGIDTSAGTQGSAVFEIWGDEKLLFRSEEMGRFTEPRHIEVDVTGMHNLKLVTTDAGNGNTDDHTDWLNPQLWP